MGINPSQKSILSPDEAVNPDRPSFAFPEPPLQMEKAVSRIALLSSGRLSTEKSIETFFRLLPIINADQHSQFRLEFWQPYLKNQLIHQAWIILAPKAEEISRAQLGVRPYQFGRLGKHRRVDENHAVLLMRVDQLVIAEWSHTGKCRFWRQQNPHAPSFFQSRYQRADLIDFADHVQQHYFSTKGYWQKDAAAWMQGSGVAKPF